MRALGTVARFAARGAIVLAITGIVFVVGLATGCGGPPKAAQTALAVTATGVQAADEATATAYGLRADACYDEHETTAGYLDCVSRVEAAIVGVTTARASLYASQAALDSWKAGTDEDGGGFMAIVPCLAETIARLLEAGEAAGVELPGELQQGAALLGAFGEGCEL